MKNLGRIVLIALILTLPTPCTADVVSGNQLYEWLQHIPKKDKDAVAGLALGFVAGVREGTGVGCIPNSVSRTQLVDIVRQYLEKHPESRHLYAAGLVKTAIEEKFPCPKTK